MTCNFFLNPFDSIPFFFSFFAESKTQEVLKMYDLQVPKSPSIDGSGSDTDIEDYSEHVSQSESKRSYDVPDIYDVSTDDEASKK